MSTELVAIVLMVLAVPLLATAFYAWFVVLGPHIAGRPTGVRVVPLPHANVRHSWHQDLPVIPAALDLPRYQARSPHPVLLSAYAEVESLGDVPDPWRSSAYAITATVHVSHPQAALPSPMAATSSP
jgi:hypothetical protein